MIVANRSKYVRVLAFLAAFAAGGLALTGRADAITFDFTLPGGSPASVYYVGGPQLTQGSVTVNAMAIPRAVHQDQDGIGVVGGLVDPPGDEPQVDGLNPTEALTLLFSERVQMQSITFTRVGLGDNATIFVNGSMTFFGSLQNGDATDTGLFKMDINSNTDTWKGTQFTFAALLPGDDYKISRVEVATAPLAPTPNAFTAGLLVMAVAGGVRMVRRPARMIGAQA